MEKCIAVASAARKLPRCLEKRAAPGDLVLVKGSRSARTERVLEEFAKRQSTAEAIAMMYYLHRLSEQIKASTFSITSRFARSRRRSPLSRSRLLFGNFVIRKLISLKVGQPIRTAEEVRRLAELHGGKQGTPTMGGVLVIGAVFVFERPLGAAG